MVSTLQSLEATCHCKGSHCPQEIRDLDTDPVILFLVFYPGAKYSQEIHYADPVFQQVAPRDQGEPQFGIGDAVEMGSGFSEANISFRNPRMG